MHNFVKYKRSSRTVSSEFSRCNFTFCHSVSVDYKVYIPKNQSFSFWKHIGYPGKSQGYVLGRDIRQGCVIPTIAGGLCQLSNALYDLALKAQFTILEWHRHSHFIEGSQNTQNRDATVKWNYIDLRFQASFEWGIKIQFTQDQMIVDFTRPPSSIPTLYPSFDLVQINTSPQSSPSQSTLKNCYS